MPHGVLLESPAPLNRRVYLLRRDRSFLDQPVREHRGGGPVKKVEHPVVDPTKPYAKLVDAVPEIISLGPAEFVSKLFEACQLDPTLGLSPRRQAIQPVEQRDGTVVLGVAKRPSLQASLPPIVSQYCDAKSSGFVGILKPVRNGVYERLRWILRPAARLYQQLPG